MPFQTASRLLTIATAGAVAIAAFFSGPAVSSEGAAARAAQRGVNFLTEVMRFPDRGHRGRGIVERDEGPPAASEQMRFMDRFMKLEEKKIASLGGRPPLDEGPAKEAYEKEIMLLQAGVLFDMRLGAAHPKRSAFLAIVGWTYDRKLPLMRAMKRHVVAKTAVFKKAEAEDFKRHDELLVEVKRRFADLFTDAEYERMLRQKKGAPGTD